MAWPQAVPIRHAVYVFRNVCFLLRRGPPRVAIAGRHDPHVRKPRTRVAALIRALLSAVVAPLMLMLMSQSSGRAGLDAAPAGVPTLEVLVFEHADCVYCRVFRRDVLPQYHQAVRANAAPLRFVDIEKDDTASLGLNSHIDTLPTAVVMRNGREVDRIVGYWGPAGFFRLLSHILGKME